MFILFSNIQKGSRMTEEMTCEQAEDVLLKCVCGCTPDLSSNGGYSNFTVWCSGCGVTFNDHK